MKRPDKDLSWWIKWVASLGLLGSLLARSIGGEGGYYFLDNALNFIGVFGWLIVGLLWRDKSIILSQFAGTVMVIYVLYEASS
tara:strand:- start:568 stop:816 length:249 start_codon:yes stop_codon:yes gene_type:complete